MSPKPQLDLFTPRVAAKPVAPQKQSAAAKPAGPEMRDLFDTNFSADECIRLKIEPRVES